MPVKEFSKSMKAKMYDFTYTPFMSSMVIAWIVLNHKYILIYMASFDLDKKLQLLKDYDFSLFNIPYAYNIFIPILFGLFYTYLYPMISKKFYQYTLNRTKELKTIKKDIEDKTPITEEEAKEYKEQFILMSAEIQELRTQLSDANKLVLEKNTNHLKAKEIAEYISPKNRIMEDDKTKILRFLYESNYNWMEKESLISQIISNKNISRLKIEKILDVLISEQILTIDDSIDEYITITSEGKKSLLSLFDKEVKNK